MSTTTTVMADDEAVLSTDEAAAFLGVKPATLRNWRTKGTGPEFIRYRGLSGTVVYLRDDLVAYRERFRVKPCTGGESR